MDIQLEKKKGIQKKHLPYIGGGAVILLLLGWIIFGNHASTLKVDGKSLNIADVTYGKFNDYIRVNGQVQPISVVQLSPEEGGIVQEKVVEEGAHVKKGDVILRLSNSNLDLQILNAESELAEKQNLLRNTQVTMQQDKLNNETEKVQLDIDTRRKQRTFQQYQRLYKERLISREEYLQAKEDYEVAQKKHKLITERLVQDSIYRNIQMDQMEDNLQNMRKNVLLIRERKDKLEVRATIDGELGLLDAELGQNINAGQREVIRGCK
jgi:HlyD family secretion protein